MKWTVLKVDGGAKVDGLSKSGRSLAKMDVHLHQTGRSGTIVDVYFHFLGPFSFIPLGRTVFVFQPVHCLISGPSTFSLLDRPI